MMRSGIERFAGALCGGSCFSDLPPTLTGLSHQGRERRFQAAGTRMPMTTPLPSSRLRAVATPRWNSATRRTT